MNDINKNCPVCGCKIHNSDIEFCTDCGWELIVISENASSSLKRFYDEKVNMHKRAFGQINKLKELINIKLASIEDFKNETIKSKLENKLINSQLESKTNELETLKTKILVAEKNNSKIIELEKEIRSLTVKLKVFKQNDLDEIV